MYVRGVTSNPTIFAKALSSGSAYAEQVHDLAIRGVTVEEASRAITTYDIRWACDVLRPVYDATDGVDGRVSIEVDPRLAHDTDKTIAEARALWWMVDRPNMFIKIPATLEGLPAITQCLSEGISVNVTLIFSLERYGQVIDAHMAGPGGRVGPRRRQHRVGGVVLRQPGRHRSGRAARQDRHARGEGAARQGRARQRPARLRAVRAAVRDPALGSAGSARRQAAAPALGVDQHQGPVVRRHHVRHRAGRAGHRQHDARGDHPRDRRSRPAARRRDPWHVRRSRGGYSSSSRRSACTTTTSSRCWSSRASRSSPPPGPSCWTRITREMAAGGSTT